jgi:hypothetical protein
VFFQLLIESPLLLADPVCRPGAPRTEEEVNLAIQQVRKSPITVDLMHLSCLLVFYGFRIWVHAKLEVFVPAAPKFLNDSQGLWGLWISGLISI